jgi:hypothetical protein
MWAVGARSPRADVAGHERSDGSKAAAQSRCRCTVAEAASPSAVVGGGEPSPGADVGWIETQCGGAPCPRAGGCLDGLGHSWRARSCACVCLSACVREWLIPSACVRVCVCLRACLRLRVCVCLCTRAYAYARLHAGRASERAGTTCRHANPDKGHATGQLR